MVFVAVVALAGQLPREVSVRLVEVTDHPRPLLRRQEKPTPAGAEGVATPAPLPERLAGLVSLKSTGRSNDHDDHSWRDY